MEKQFWLDLWDRNEIEFHQGDVSPALKTFWPRLGLAPGAKVFVPLCGKSRDLFWLREQGHEVLGVELARVAVRDFFAESGLAPQVTAQPPFERWAAEGITISCGDFFDLTAPDLGGVTAVYDRAALVALPAPMRRRYVEQLRAMLPDAVEILLVTATYPPEQMEGPPFSVSEEEVRALYAPPFHVEMLLRKDIFRPDSALARRGLRQLLAQIYRIRKGT